MTSQLTTPGAMLAQITDGASAWADFMESAGSALANNEAFAALVGLSFLGLAVLFAHWKLAGWLGALLERKHTNEKPKS